MNLINEKDNIKDLLILSLIDCISDLFTINYNIEKKIIKNHLLSKLDSLNILDIDIKQDNILEIKNNIFSIFTKELSQNLFRNNISFFDNFINHELLGSGGYANVYKVYNPLDDTNYAIKKIGIKNNFYQSIFELRSLAKLNHKNIVRYYSSWIESIKINNAIKNCDNIIIEENTNTQLVKFNNNFNDLNSFSSESSDYDEEDYDKFVFIQMELCKQNLKEYLNVNKLNNYKKQIICKQIINGLKYIHKNEIIHRDLKLTNIFIDYNNNVKIGDFGLAKNIYDLNYDEVGTYSYIAPEIIEGKNYSYTADLYSLGVIILEIFKNSKTEMEKIISIKEIKNGKYLFDNNDLNDLLSKLINDDPNKRVLPVKFDLISDY